MANGYYIREILHQGAKKTLGPQAFTSNGDPFDFTPFLAADAEVVAKNSDGTISITGTIEFSVGDSGELDTATATFAAAETANADATDELRVMVRVNSGTTSIVLWYGEFLPRLEVA